MGQSISLTNEKKIRVGCASEKIIWIFKVEKMTKEQFDALENFIAGKSFFFGEIPTTVRRTIDNWIRVVMALEAWNNL